ncbi:RNA 2'-phosphotransferase [Halorussus caseinilyticus]|uniref:RNA 2'-phosphotransferase n=1 Tax=Halorussus caseinilyticus TaxID=3034025 RepID=UPI0023E8E478|nr:RNA 2'-phosphotransferase [Halorussus sp. DT72]
MTDAIVRCPTHGYVTVADSADPRCPDCGADAERVLSGERRRRLSKFVSGALRHFPDDAGLELDRRGWADYDALEAAVGRKYDWADAEDLAAVVATDPKGRFERSEADGNGKIRAAYGHSVDVTLEAESEGGGDVPDRLYHGTDPENLDAILAEGLKPMGRREVHLSGSRATAREVGSRHAADPVVLAIDAAAMVADGLRISKRGAETHTADEVPPEYLDVLS